MGCSGSKLAQDSRRPRPATVAELDLPSQDGRVVVDASWTGASAGASSHLEHLNGLNAAHSAAGVGLEQVPSSPIAQDLTGLNKRTTGGKSGLHLAASLGRVEIVQILLAQMGIDINAKDDNGRTPLHEAAEAGHEVVAGLLYEGGANLELRERDDKSAADLAVAGGHLPVLKMLNEKGADFGKLAGNAVLLHAAALREDLPIMKFLLDAGIDPDAKFSGLTPSMRTLRHQSLDALRMLLKAGAKAEMRTPSGAMLLAHAIINGTAARTKLLLRSTIDPQVAVNDTGGGISALHAAIENAVRGGDEKIISVLLGAGARIHDRQSDGVNAAGLCRVHGRPDLLEIIKASYIPLFEKEERTYAFIRFLPLTSSDYAYKPAQIPFFGTIATVEDDLKEYVYLTSNATETTFGWRIEEGTKFRRADGSKHNDKDLAEFLQHLLFFGLLKQIATVMGMNFSCQSLVRRLEDGRLCFYTDPLNDFIVEWASGEQLKQEEAFGFAEKDPSWNETAKILTQARLRTIDTFLEIANDLARLAFEQNPEDMGTWQLPEQEPGPEDPSVPRKWTQDPLNVTGLLIVMLGNLLVTAREQIYTPELRLESDKYSNPKISAQARQYERGGALVEDYGNSDLFMFSCQFTIQAMVENRCCPSEIHMLHSTVEPSSLYFSTLLTRPRGKLDHKLCNNFSCVMMQIDESTYQTKHLCNGGDCELISVDVTVVHAMLDAGQYPVIRVKSDGEHGAIGLHVEPAYKKGYIAISHVWGHGLGNPSENGLPTCQLRRLNRFTKLKLPDTDFGISDLPIWIDTLCVPVENSGRRKALQLLHKVYSEAWVTIVLDEELLAVSAPDSQAEKAARLLSSSWMRRLWTLEEALLGSIGLCYAFADRIVQHWEVVGYKEPDCHFFEKAVTRDLSDGLSRTIYNMWGGKWEEGHRLLSVLQACCYRTTSRQADVLICLSSLLDLDVSQLWDVKTDEHERERAFYTMLGAETRLNSEDCGIPVQLLFMEGPRMCLPGFTWAPVSFLSRPISDILTTRIDVPPAYVRENGLHVTMMGYILDIPEHQTNQLTAWEDLWGKSFAFEDVANDVAYVVRPNDFIEYKSQPPPLNGRKVALLRQAELTPWALLTLVENMNDTLVVVSYLARCRAFDWSTEEFRRKVGIPMSWIGGPRRSAYASQIHLEPQALVAKALSTTHPSLTESGISVSQDEEWKVRTRLYPAELVTKQTWKIV